MKIQIVIFVIGILSISCNRKDLNQKNAAIIGDHPISLSEVDNEIAQELFDELNKVYLLRKQVLDSKIDEFLLNEELIKRNTSRKALFDSIINIHRNDSSIEKFTKSRGFDKGIINVERNYEIVKPNCEKWKILAQKAYRESLEKKLIDSLKKNVDIKYLIKPPLPISIKLKNYSAHYKGNLDSKITLVIFSDFECDICRKAEPTYIKIFNKYGSKIRFGFSHYGTYVSISALASEAAAKQNKFWEMHDSLYSLQNLPDTNRVINIAQHLNLNLDKFKYDLRDKNQGNLIMDNFIQLNNSGLYGTPTVMLNNLILYNSLSFDEISASIDNLLDMVK